VFGLLAGDQVGRHPIELGAESSIAGVRPGKRGGVHPLAHMFANPRMDARFLAKPREQGFLVHLEQPVLLIDRHAAAQKALDLHGRG
jgi:catechol 2,3-dioxygenase-like lactoylglutathione lyase family enzyme